MRGSLKSIFNKHLYWQC